MKLMLRRNLRIVLVLFFLCLVFSVLIYYLAVTPWWKTEQFIEFYVLDKNRMAVDYYPIANETIPLGTQVRWFITAVNHMNSSQDIIVKLKLSNSTLASPQRKPPKPAPIPSFLEFQKILPKSETWELPFFWSIKNITVVEDTMYITEMMINNKTIVDVPNIGAIEGRRFRLIFELWTLDKQMNEYIFGFKSEEKGKGQLGLWLRMWFDVQT